MGKQSMHKLYFRSLLLIIYSMLMIYDAINSGNLLNKVMYYKVFGFLQTRHIIWAYMMYEMVVVLIPRFNIHSYSGKHLLKHFNPVKDFEIGKLLEYTKQNGVRAIRSALFWILFNTPFIILYFTGIINEHFIYWLFIFYYFFDTFSINVLCPFHLFVTKNKCCNQCRIYNWGHMMYCTPLMLLPNFINYSLVVISVIILVQWEISVYRYPERFSPVTNQVLQCTHCPHECRYNPNKKQILASARRLKETILSQATHNSQKSIKS